MSKAEVRKEKLKNVDVELPGLEEISKLKQSQYAITDEHLVSLEELAKRLGTEVSNIDPSKSRGLPIATAAQRLKENGKNKLTPPKQKPEIVKFLLHFTNLFNVSEKGSFLIP